MDNPLLYFKDLENKSVWSVYEIVPMKETRNKWLNGKCIEPGDDDKAFIGQKIGVPAETVFNRPEKYDVSKEPFIKTV